MRQEGEWQEERECLKHCHLPLLPPYASAPDLCTLPSSI
jgi:hypothetical protein